MTSIFRNCSLTVARGCRRPVGTLKELEDFSAARNWDEKFSEFFQMVLNSKHPQPEDDDPVNDVADLSNDVLHKYTVTPIIFYYFNKVFPQRLVHL